MIQKAGLIAVLGASLLAGCQSYDFEPVEPLAVAQASESAQVAGTRNTPNLMLVVDKSGSMNAPTDPSDSDCTDGCRAQTQLCSAGCPTRWTDLQSAMSQFLSNSGTVARMGLTTYPNNAVCDAPANPRIDLATTDDPATLQSKADEVRNVLNGITMALSTSAGVGDAQHTGGGTPTGNTIQALKNYSALADPERDNYILLLTDGLPNCNPNNPNDYVTNPEACFCQASNCSAEFRKLGCLDAAGTIEQISDLSGQDPPIRTIVVGFGIDTNDQRARDTLQGMAQAGGFPRDCESDADCDSGNTCNVQKGECNNKYFSAKNAAELAKALAEIGTIFNENICNYKLDVTPQNNSSEFIAVRVDGENVVEGPNTWAYSTEGGSRVLIQGQLCERLKAAKISDPVDLEIRVIQAL